MKIGNTRIAALFAALVLLLPATGYGYELMPTLSIGLGESYNDNIYLTHSDRKGDFVTSITPGIDLSLKSLNTEIVLGYHPGFNYYASHSDRNNVSQALNAGAIFRLSERLTVSLKDNFVKSEENRDIRTVYLGSLSQNIKREINVLSGDVAYKISQRLTSTLTGSYSDTTTSGSGSSVGDVKSYYGGIMFAYTLTERTSLNLNYKHNIFDYKNSSDATSDDYTAGITYKLSDTMTLTANGGVSRTKIEDSGRTSTGFTGGATITKRFERSDIALAYNRGVAPNIDNNDTTTTQIFSLKYNRRMSELLTAGLNAFYSINKSAIGSSTDTRETGAGANFSYMLSKDLSLVLSYNYINHDDRISNLQDYRNHIAMLAIRYTYGKKLEY
ncbi:MAG: hypothetical protein LLF86_00985 [Nitrospiraceae bacterium]|nr:hypothetical protein [Nitrospiraceae bacterium]